MMMELVILNHSITKVSIVWVLINDVQMFLNSFQPTCSVAYVLFCESWCDRIAEVGLVI